MAAVAELLPAPRAELELRGDRRPVPAGDGPNSPWFDWRRARGAAEEGPEQAGNGPADEASETDGTSAARTAALWLPEAEAAEESVGAQPVPRQFPWFG